MTPGTRIVISSIALTALLTCTARGAEPFRILGADQYAHQTSDQVTIGAKALSNQEEIADVFGKKSDLLRYGVTPVLVVIANKRKETLDLQEIEISLVASDGRHVKAIRPEDISTLAGSGKRHDGPQVQLPIPLPKKKHPLSSPEIQSRAFVAKVLAPGDSASGFFYFAATPEADDQLYVNGLRALPSEKELFYFEFSLAREK